MSLRPDRYCWHCQSPSDLAKFSPFCRPCSAIPGLRREWLHRVPAPATDICPFTPGSAAKLDLMQLRAASGESLCGALDRTKIKSWRIDYEEPNEIVEPNDEQLAVEVEERTREERPMHGLERHDGIYRARPVFEGKRKIIGEYATRAEAEFALYKFWSDRLGLFWSLFGRMWLFRRKDKQFKSKRHK